MHPALLIDELLQLIFEDILNDGKPTLCSVARCCQAWKDPALDRIWRRLPSAIPVLSLLPGFSMEDDNIRLTPTTQDVTLTAFHSYATRVRHIVHCHRILTSDPMHLFDQLNNLESARIKSRAAGEATLYMSLAPRLRSLKLQVAYSKHDTTSITMHGMMSLLKGHASLEQLSVRGHSPECLWIPLNNLTNLRSLSLHLSSLTVRALMTASTFPFLADFDVHANRVSYDLLTTAIGEARGAPFFPALEKLRIRGELALVTLILGQLPGDRLDSLYIDTICPGPSPAFDDLFKAMVRLPLHEFILEHTLSADESEDIPVYTPDRFFFLDHLRPLSKLPFTCFIMDTPLPLDMTDSAIEEMTTWWPLLERLELGARTALENAQTAWKPRNTLTSLRTLAKGCKHLQSLVITLDAGAHLLSDTGVIPLGCHSLVSLSMSSCSRPDVSSLSAMLATLFPCLVDLTPGFVGEHEDAWTAVKDALSSTLVSGSL